MMAGWGGLGGYLEDLSNRRGKAADPADSSPDANLTRRACDAAARVGGVVAGAPHVRFTCGPYWDGQDDYEPPDEVIPGEPPFNGGQCPGVAYEVFVTRISTSTGQPSEVKLPGTFQGPVTITTPTNTLNQAGDPLENSWQYTVNDGRPDEDSRTSISDGPPSFRVERADGQPDDCGDPPPGPDVLPPGRDVPGLPPFGSPVPIGDPNDPNDTTPPVIFPPPGTPYDPWIPIINPPPSFPPFVFPPSSGDDIPPREGPETDVPPGGTDGSDIPGPEPVIPSEVCIGYAFDFYDIPANRGGIPDSSPARYYEIFGSAQLKIGTDSGEFYDLPVKIDSRRGVCYRSDESLKVIGLSLNSKLSFGPVRVKPIFVLKENKF